MIEICDPTPRGSDRRPGPHPAAGIRSSIPRGVWRQTAFLTLLLGLIVLGVAAIGGGCGGGTPAPSTGAGQATTATGATARSTAAEAGLPSLVLPAPVAEFPESVVFAEAPDLASTLSMLPKEVVVYRYVPANLGRDEVAALGSKLGMSGAVRGKTGGFLSIVDGDRRLAVQSDSGEWTYSVTGRVGIEPADKAAPFPTDDEIWSIAEKQLDELGLRQEGVQRLKLGQFVAGDTVVSRNAVFARRVDGLLDRGPSTLQVAVGPGGDIVFIANAMRPVEAYGHYRLKDPAEALAEAKSGEGTYSLSQFAKSATIESADVQYYETTAPLSEQPYLLPVFVFSGTAQGLQEEEEFVLIVPALAG